MLKINNLSCGYGKIEIVKDLSFTVKKGEIFSITGPNGCGKTTLLRAIAGLIPYNSGSININGHEIKEMKRRDLAFEIAMLAQTGASGDYADFTVYDTVMTGRYAYKKPLLSKGIKSTSDSCSDNEIIKECMRKTGISDLRNRFITELSGGQLQRVFLAKAFAQTPSLILLDEPSNHLDLKRRLELTELLRGWVKDGKSVISVFHDLNLAASISDRILVMDEGKEIICSETAKVCKSNELEHVYGFNVKEYMIRSLKFWE